MGMISNVFVEIGAKTTALAKGLDAAKAMIKRFSGDKEANGQGGGGGGILSGLKQGGLMGAGMKAFDMAASSVSSIGNAIAQSSKMGADLNETISKTGVILGGASGDAVAFAKSLQDSGQGQMKDILESIVGSSMAMKGLGTETNKAIDIAKSLEERVGDIASQSNLDPKQIRENLQSAFAGEYQILRKYQVFIDADSIKKSGKPIGEAMAEEFLKQTASAKGDFENTKFSTSNMERTNDNTVLTMMTQLGQALQPLSQAFAYLKGVVLNAIGAIDTSGFTVFIEDMRQTLIEMSSGIALAVTELAQGLLYVAKFFLQAASIIGGFIGDALIGFGGFTGVFARMGLELAYRLAQGIDLLIQPFRWIAKQLGITMGEGMTAIVDSLGQQRAALDQKAGENIAEAAAKRAADKAKLDAALKQQLPEKGEKGELDKKQGKDTAKTNGPEAKRLGFSALLNDASKTDKSVDLLSKIEANTKPQAGKQGAVDVVTKKPGPDRVPQLAGA